MKNTSEKIDEMAVNIKLVFIQKKLSISKSALRKKMIGLSQFKESESKIIEDLYKFYEKITKI